MTKAPPGFTRTLLSIAVPVTLQNLLASSFTLAAVGMAGKWTWFLTIVFFGFSSGASVFISQFYGAGDDAGMRRTYGLMTVGTQAASLLFMLAALLFPEGIVRLFSSDEQAIALGASYLRIIAISYPFLALTRGRRHALRPNHRLHHHVSDRAAADDADRALSALERACNLSGDVPVGRYRQMCGVSLALPLRQVDSTCDMRITS